MENKAHALARDELIRVLTAYKGITTSDGEGDGTTLIDSNLKDNPSISASAIPEKTILITSGDAIQEDKGAASFDNDTGKITFQAGFSVQITAGTTFRILNISSVEMDIARIEDKIDSLAGGAFWGSYGPRNVEVDNDVDFGIMLHDPSGNIITTGEITPGTYTIRRVRGAVDTEIVSATASSEAAGRVYMTYAFPAASWAVGDIFYITFIGISVTIDTTTTEYPNLYIWGRVVREADISAKIGTATDNADLATLFARANKIVLPTHAHALLVVHDAANLDADLDTALRDWMLGLGDQVTIADPADVAVDLDVDAFDFIVVSGSCLVGDAGNLANLREANAPVLCHSAAIAVAVFFLGGTAGSEATQTQIEIIDNSPAWLIDVATGDLTVTASATIQTMETKATNATTKAEEASGTGAGLTIVKLKQGLQDGGVPSYAPFYDRYFNGVADYTLANAAWKAIMAGFLHHMLHEKRFGEGTVQLKRVPQEQIPDTDFSLAAIDNALTADPPSADAENSIVDLDQRVNLTYVLRSLWVNVTSFGTGASMTFQLWVLLNGSVTSVDSVVVSSTGIQNLMDIFGLQEVHADGIWITAVVDSGNTGACEGTYRYAEARK